MSEDNRHIAFICSKGDLDMAYPALVMGWAALGNGIDVTIFFTFWGMDIINKKRQNHLELSPITKTSMKMSMMGLPTGNLGIPNIYEHHTWNDSIYFLVHEEKNRRSWCSSC